MAENLPPGEPLSPFGPPRRRQMRTTSSTRIRDRVGLDQPAVSMDHLREFGEDGLLDDTRQEHATCGSCGGILRDDTIGAFCRHSGLVICAACAERQCEVCGASVSRRHAVQVGERTFCSDHFMALACGYALAVAGAVLGIAFVVYLCLR